ncbi:MAG: divalent-cation tolerance protein CutA [Candidatus Diapherotrites archaeon]|uniref:Divalent-cation tolerance protein CutA n=1 Tax=Candidatus Iainarchaeum sp. TaxID=3101447 RepID=A0A8T4L2R9_9ARCH|nr:divalent-cation tolerance protein CutA [Candidatus Diapherotrites archaeon]
MSTIGFVSFPTRQDAKETIARLLEKRLIACAQIVPEIESAYRWKGRIETNNETLVLLKTNPTKINDVISEIQKHHSYELPVIEFINVDHSTPAVQQWINDETK